jgi:2,4-diaminopentanoate dehydrogenase
VEATVTLRVVQWTLGNVGRLAVHGILERSDLELVGAYVYDPEKDGVDVGRLCGISEVGVAATHDADRLLRSAPECVVYMPFEPHLDELETILGHGVNVVSTAGFITGRYLSDDFPHRLDAAARDGGVSCFATGINPGYVNQLCLQLTSACRRIGSIELSESADCTTYAAPEMWTLLGFGLPPTDGMGPRAERLTSQFFDAIDVMAEALGTRCDGHRSEVEYAVAAESFSLPWMEFPLGTVCGQRSRWIGTVAGSDFIRAEVLWKMRGPADPDWPVREGYEITVDGHPRLEVTWRQGPGRRGGRRGQSEDYLTGALSATAMAAVNAIPVVCAAPPGLRTFADLPLAPALEGTSG